MPTSKFKNPLVAAKIAELIYVNDLEPGFKRVRSGKSFNYLDLELKTIKDPKVLNRIKALGIPPAYEDVWICPVENGHLQATGRDEKGRKQYRYHIDWSSMRAQMNQAKIIEFAKALPNLRQQIEKDLNQTSISKTRVLATVVKLLDMTLIRVGNDVYAKENQSYGLTTMRDKHVKIKDSLIRFEFKGKSHQKHTIELKNKKLAKIVQQCLELPGYELFQYYDEGGTKQRVDSRDVNEYLQQATGQEFTAKDFRTWWATVFAIMALGECEACEKNSQLKKNLKEAVALVAKKLGNTPTVCRKHYIYPGVLDSYLEGKLGSVIQKLNITDKDNSGNELGLLSSEEKCTLRFLESHQSATIKRLKARNKNIN